MSKLILPLDRSLMRSLLASYFQVCQSKRADAIRVVGSVLDFVGHSSDFVQSLGETIIKKFGVRFNVWTYNTGFGHTYSKEDKYLKKHPAVFPEKLAQDHIISWSNKNDLVYDPFMGSGTTAKMAILNKRQYIGSEINTDYYNLAIQRIENINQQKFYIYLELIR